MASGLYITCVSCTVSLLRHEITKALENRMYTMIGICHKILLLAEIVSRPGFVDLAASLDQLMTLQRVLPSECLPTSPIA